MRSSPTEFDDVSMLFRVDAQRRLVTSRLEGEFTHDDAIDMQRQLAERTDFEPKFDHLCDATRAGHLRLDADGIEAIIEVSPFAPTARHAVVVSRDATYGVARMFQSLAEGRFGEVRIFRTMEEARIWLGSTG